METCCYIKHLPTGIEVKQDGRSKSGNYKRALEELERRLRGMQEYAVTERYRELKRKALERGGIRTYNYTNGTVIDHITGKTAKLKKVMNGNLDLLK